VVKKEFIINLSMKPHKIPPKVINIFKEKVILGAIPTISYLYEMLKNLKVEKRIEIQAAIGRVWRTITDPDTIKLYFFGTQVICDWKVGSPIIFQGEWQGQTYKDKGTIIPDYILMHDSVDLRSVVSSRQIGN
jgi:hypothetical protein